MPNQRWLLNGALPLLVAASACGSVTLSKDGGVDSAPDVNGGSGGAAGTGGAGSGGVAGTGGVTGTGGTVGTGGATGTGGVTGTGGAPGHDDCQRDSDCPTIMCIKAPCPTNVCVLSTDGYHHCRLRQVPALEMCNPNFSLPCCTSDADCTMRPHGACVPSSIDACGGPARIGNECRYDNCQSDADCTAMPRGVCSDGYPRSCFYGPCRQNSDCTAHPGGVCQLAVVGLYCRGDAVFCKYPSDPCQSNADCKGSLMACVPNDNGQGTVCKTQPPPPP